ncbi:MAG: PHP domain-containing protein [Treponema sp.]|jgi:predicted metal-dependent phosphoesterase TrpH|nr:PHP domain-containing protein [Treponema sp.]
MVDLHVHSNASDGDYSPDLLVREAKKRGIKAFALTDHDTLGGLQAAEHEANAVGIRFIPGIEINISWTGKSVSGAPGLGPGGEFHLLGLGIRSPTPAFLAAIGELSRRREARNREILDRMHELSIEASWEDVLALSGGHSVGRPHFANLLVNKKIVKNTAQAFARYLKPGRPLYVPKAGLDFAEATELIRESGGIPVLAHPMSLYVAWGRLPDLIKKLKDFNLMGIETWHPSAKPKACRRLEKLGKALGLYLTEGSDFHGAARPDRKLGCSNSGREISDTVLEAIPELYS